MCYEVVQSLLVKRIKLINPKMKFKLAFFFLSIFMVGCQNSNKSSEAEPEQLNQIDTIEKIDSSEDTLKSGDHLQAKLALTSNALQVVKLPSGSTSELGIGMEMETVLEIVSNVLGYEIPEPQVNSECGAGSMTISVFENGLVLMFQKRKGDEAKLEFVGWSVSENDQNKKLTTMSNIGIGSTRAELESAYNVEVEQTSLGMEFSTVPGGLYGIIDGSSKSSKINFMWSGLSCNFR